MSNLKDKMLQFCVVIPLLLLLLWHLYSQRDMEKKYTVWFKSQNGSNAAVVHPQFSLQVETNHRTAYKIKHILSNLELNRYFL